MTQEAPEQRTCLMIAAHPDDIESWCASAVAVWVRQGWGVVHVLCTSGEKGASDPGKAPAAVAACSMLRAALILYTLLQEVNKAR